MGIVRVRIRGIGGDSMVCHPIARNISIWKHKRGADRYPCRRYPQELTAVKTKFDNENHS
ncbi:hypothetical protein RSPO_m01414 (plasmid) [Ralstonia solanacearum Po82]|uniref:Uncharacterized protein n=1 Tax=Ralstonia solanacearum (strain Po82) TaxID=1031711 RepID=F6GBI3_RALS8|nr:hypothetical protein [Ralstonia solanacearum]AEG72049.1 hypothetical protein RSPO_m01414 [Ralstonia solanacearum Po82]MDB0562936.1 hypothetical protein [Ralstonia solanacearum]MDD7809849.1 hypothetical protein [Ralstonia solanacearum]